MGKWALILWWIKKCSLPDIHQMKMATSWHALNYEKECNSDDSSGLKVDYTLSAAGEWGKPLQQLSKRPWLCSWVALPQGRDVTTRPAVMVSSTTTSVLYMDWSRKRKHKFATGDRCYCRLTDVVRWTSDHKNLQIAIQLNVKGSVYFRYGDTRDANVLPKQCLKSIGYTKVFYSVKR